MKHSEVSEREVALKSYIIKAGNHACINFSNNCTTGVVSQNGKHQEINTTRASEERQLEVEFEL